MRKVNDNELLNTCPKCGSHNVKQIQSPYESSYREEFSIYYLICIDCSHAWTHMQVNSYFVSKEKEKQRREEESKRGMARRMARRDKIRESRNIIGKWYCEKLEDIVTKYEKNHPIKIVDRERTNEIFNERWNQMLNDKNVFDEIFKISIEKIERYKKLLIEFETTEKAQNYYTHEKQEIQEYLKKYENESFVKSILGSQPKNFATNNNVHK